MKNYLCILLCLIYLGCSAPQPFFKELKKTDNKRLKTVFDAPNTYKPQIIFSEIIRNTDGSVEFKDHRFHLDDSVYFYPASTVKLPVSILALEKLNKLSERQNIQISKDTHYKIEGDTLYHTIKNDIQAIFTVSDNEAYNRLFDFVGADEINAKLRSKGLSPVRISHRLSTKDAFNLKTKPMTFELQKDQENQVFKLPASHNSEIENLKLEAIKKGNAYYQNDTLINSSFDFSLKNYFPLSVQHNVMKKLFFAENFELSSRFKLNADDKDFLFKAMSRLPREAGYDQDEYYDSYAKFFMFGDSKQSIPKNIKIYNKVGYAYGTLTETAYIKDESNGVEFILSATILVNKNQIFNDDDYEYDTIGIPFFSELGKAVYAHELEKRLK